MRYTKTVAKYFIIFALLLSVFLVYAPVSEAYFDSPRDMLAGVKNGYMDNYTGDNGYAAIGPQFNSFFTNPSWKAYRQDGHNRVDFSGNAYWNGVSKKFWIRFIETNEGYGRFRINSIWIGGVMRWGYTRGGSYTPGKFLSDIYGD